MPTVYKVLGQSNPAATTETTLYTVPSLTSTVVSTIMVCNQSVNQATYRIVIRPAADGSTTAKHYIIYDAILAGNDAIAITIGVTLATGDLIRVYASNANLSFSAYGSEIS